MSEADGLAQWRCAATGCPIPAQVCPACTRRGDRVAPSLCFVHLLVAPEQWRKATLAIHEHAWLIGALKAAQAADPPGQRKWRIDATHSCYRAGHRQFKPGYREAREAFCKRIRRLLIQAVHAALARADQTEIAQHA